MTLRENIRRALMSECKFDFGKLFKFPIPLNVHRAGPSQRVIARNLGVSREYLNQVLNGKKESEKLLIRYQQLGLPKQKRKNQYA